RAENRRFLRVDQRVGISRRARWLAGTSVDRQLEEGAARTVLGRRAVAGVHGLALDARMVVYVVMQEAAGRPALRLALEIAERAVVVFIGGAERTHLPGRRIDGHTDRCPAD